MSDYGRRIVVDSDFARTVDNVVRAFKDEGLDVISRFDVRDYLRHTIQHDFRSYVLLQVSAPRLMLEALRDDLGVGAILPITIAVHELADGETAVVASEPFGAVLGDAAWRRAAPALAELADEESAQVARALSRLAHLKGVRHMPAIGFSAAWRYEKDVPLRR
jgi:uncharacterized protein (DUF302 family)